MLTEPAAKFVNHLVGHLVKIATCCLGERECRPFIVGEPIGLSPAHHVGDHLRVEPLALPLARAEIDAPRATQTYGGCEHDEVGEVIRKSSPSPLLHALE